MVYSDNDLRKIASQYTTRKEFERGKQTAYQCAIRRGPFVDKNGNIVKYSKYRGTPKSFGLTNTFGFLNEICNHMIPQGNLYKRIIYVYKFYDENNNNSAAYIGLTYNPDKRNNQHLHRITQKSPVKKFIEKNPTFKYEFEILTDFVDKETAKKLEIEYINKFKDDGWQILNIAKGGVLGSNNETPINVLQEIIKKYDNYIDFINNENGAYKTICRRKLFELTDHLKRKNRRKYSDEDLINTAIECGSYKLFRKQYENTKFQQAYRRNLLPKIRKLLE